ncbi:MAG: hypothetical protein ACPL68_00125 [Candidatus Hydrothermia bacterium]
MLKTAYLAVIGIVLLSGCAREEKVTADDIRSYQLTEDDIALYIKSFNQIDKVMAEVQKGIDGEQMTKDPYTTFASIQFTPDQKKAIKEAGFRSTAEFLRVVGAITATYAACAMEKAVAEMKAEMEKSLPGMTPDIKANMEKEIAAMEAKAKVEYPVSDHNMEIVRKHYDDLTRAFMSGTMVP